MSALPVTRREFLKVSAVAGGGLMIGINLGATSTAEAAATAAGFENAWIKITPDNKITFVCHRNEMGQDVHTSIAMMLADELGVDPRKVTVVQAGSNPKLYINKLLGGQLTGGSTSIRDAWEPVRMAGASARMMLVGAAATEWKVPVTECKAENGMVVCGTKKLTYDELSFTGTLTAVSSTVPSPSQSMR